MRLGWDAVTLNGLRAAFDQNNLDALAQALVRTELLDRRAEKDSSEGPAPPGVADGGREVEVTLKSAPPETEAAYQQRFSLGFSLLGDATCIAISCKTGKNLANVRADYLKDANPEQEGGARVVEVLRNGGRLVLMTTQVFTATAPPNTKTKGAKASGNPKAKATEAGKPSLVKALANLYAPQSGRSEQELTSQIVVVDGNDLLEYLRQRKPIQLGDDLLKQVGVEEWPGVRSHSVALKELGRDRSLPGYLPDQGRTRLAAQLQSFVQTGAETSREMCIVGPPGVGKTRCVLEALRRFEAQVLYVLGDSSARELLLHKRLLSSAPDGILVVDDARPERVRSLVNDFRGARAGQEVPEDRPTPCLVVIVPAGSLDRDLLASVDTVMLDPLSEEEARGLIASSLEADTHDSRVAETFRVTKGYPWFGVLVAQEIVKGATVPMTTTGAAKLAICPEEFASEERKGRARALLAAMLVHETPWGDLDDEARNSLAQAVDLANRLELKRHIDACVERGVLRRDAWLYVTPGILEREVWRIVCDDEDPDPVEGERKLLARIGKHTRDRVQKLVERLERLGFKRNERVALARALLNTLYGEVATLDDLASKQHTAMVQWCARNLPPETARWLSSLVLGASDAVIHARTDVRRLLVNTFALLAGRVADFDAVEPSLFALRLGENEAYANNASAIWVLLFHPEMGLSHAPLDVRLEVLTRRCLEGSQAARISAVRGLQGLLERGAAVLVPHDATAPHSLGPSEQGRAREACWTLLLDCVADTDTAVAEEAQRVLRVVCRSTNDLLTFMPDSPSLERAMRSLSESVRSSLRRELELERSLEEASGVRSASILTRIEALTRPEGYAQRLRDHLAYDHLGVEHATETTVGLDEALVREGLAPPGALLVRHLDVLLDRESERATPFAVVAGRLDEACQLFEPLVSRASEPTGPNVLSAYCAGHHLAGRTQHVESWLRAWQHDARFATTAVLTAARCEGSESLLRIALEILRTQAVASGVYRFLASSPLRDAPDDLLRETLGVLVKLPHPGALGAALRLLHTQLRHRDTTGMDSLVIEVATAAADVLEHADVWFFEECLRWLMDHALEGPASEILLRRVAAPRTPELSTLRLVGELSGRFPDVFWAVLRARLEPASAFSARIVLRLGLAGGGIHLPAADVLAWVGHDVVRARQLVPLLDLHEDTLSPLAAGLITRFGPTSGIAKDLAASLHSTPRPVSSLAQFYETQRARAERWAQEGSPAVQEWAARAAEVLTRNRDWHVDDEAAEHRRYGT